MFNHLNSAKRMGACKNGKHFMPLKILYAFEI